MTIVVVRLSGLTQCTSPPPTLCLVLSCTVVCLAVIALQGQKKKKLNLNFFPVGPFIEFLLVLMFNELHV